MASFRIVDQLRTFYGLSGQLLAGGSLVFYTAGTTTPANVYGEPALTTNNGSTIDLDSSGRPDVDIWADTDNAFKMRLYDADDVLQGEIDNLEVPGGAGQTIPVPDSGELLTGDGTNFAVATIREVPDPAGNADKILSTDGTDLSWIAKPADGDDGTANVTQTATEFTVEDMAIVTGTGSGTAAGGRTQTATVTFATAFTSVPVFVDVVPSDTSLSSGGNNMPSWSVTAKSTTGFTVKFTMGETDDSQSSFDFNSAVDFAYIAVGVRTA
jgi:hypothetical protein